MKIKILLLSFSLLFVFFVGEVGARLLGLPKQTRPMHGDDFEWDRGGAIWDRATFFRTKPGWKGLRNTKNDEADGIRNVEVSYNSFGMRGPEVGAKSRPRVLLLGDSVVQAFEVRDADVVSQVLNRMPEGKAVEAMQMGASSWSPVQEFSWFHHYAGPLEIDRVYLFVCLNDFFSYASTSQEDIYHRAFYSYDDDGAPLVRRGVDPVFPSFFLKSALVRTLEWPIHKLVTRMDQQLMTLSTLFHAPLSREEKIRRVMNKLKTGRRPYPAPVAPDVLARLDKYIHSENIPDGHRDWADIALSLLPPEQWDSELKQGVEATLETITRFSNYLKKDGKELVVVWANFGPEIDAYENTGRRGQAHFRDGIFFPIAGVTTYVQEYCRKSGLRFLNTGEALRKYKQANCRNCPNYLHFNIDGHWNERAQAVVAKVLADDVRVHPIKI